MIHQLKIDSKYFEDVVSGKKTFEVRKNDRNFHVGDFLALNEVFSDDELDKLFDEAIKTETGRCALYHVNYILDNPEFVKDGYVVLGIKPCAVNTSTKPSIL